MHRVKTFDQLTVKLTTLGTRCAILLDSNVLTLVVPLPPRRDGAQQNTEGDLGRWERQTRMRLHAMGRTLDHRTVRYWHVRADRDCIAPPPLETHASRPCAPPPALVSSHRRTLGSRNKIRPRTNCRGSGAPCPRPCTLRLRSARSRIKVKILESLVLGGKSEVLFL